MWCYTALSKHPSTRPLGECVNRKLEGKAFYFTRAKLSAGGSGCRDYESLSRLRRAITRSRNRGVEESEISGIAANCQLWAFLLKAHASAAWRGSRFQFLT